MGFCPFYLNYVINVKRDQKKKKRKGWEHLLKFFTIAGFNNFHVNNVKLPVE